MIRWNHSVVFIKWFSVVMLTYLSKNFHQLYNQSKTVGTNLNTGYSFTYTKVIYLIIVKYETSVLTNKTNTWINYFAFIKCLMFCDVFKNICLLAFSSFFSHGSACLSFCGAFLLLLCIFLLFLLALAHYAVCRLRPSSSQKNLLLVNCWSKFNQTWPQSWQTSL